MSTLQVERTNARTTSATITFHHLDVADQQHLSANYWRWSQLFDRDPAAQITQHPDALFAELVAVASPTSHSQSTNHVKHAQSLVLCEATADDQPLALAILVPKKMSLRQAGGFGPAWNLDGYRLVGNRLLGTPSDELAQQMLRACAKFVAQQCATFLLIEDLESSDSLMSAAQSLQPDGFRLFSPSGLQERLKIEFPPNANDYWSKFSSKTRNTFRRKQKKIGQTELERITEPSQIADFLESAHAISQNTWQTQKLGLRVRNDESELRLFTFLATQQALRSYLLSVDGQPAAFLIGTQHKGLFHYEEVGYDRRYSERSPGQVLLLMVLEDLLHSDTPHTFDFGGGDADYKQLFATTTSTSGNIWIVPPGTASQSWVRYLSVCRWTDRQLRSIAKRFGLTTRLRQWIRGKRSHPSAMKVQQESEAHS